MLDFVEVDPFIEVLEEDIMDDIECPFDDVDVVDENKLEVEYIIELVDM